MKVTFNNKIYSLKNLIHRPKVKFLDLEVKTSKNEIQSHTRACPLRIHSRFVMARTLHDSTTVIPQKVLAVSTVLLLSRA
jgi:hypothetical protein